MLEGEVQVFAVAGKSPLVGKEFEFCSYIEEKDCF